MSACKEGEPHSHSHADYPREVMTETFVFGCRHFPSLTPHAHFSFGIRNQKVLCNKMNQPLFRLHTPTAQQCILRIRFNVLYLFISENHGNIRIFRSHFPPLINRCYFNAALHQLQKDA